MAQKKIYDPLGDVLYRASLEGRVQFHGYTPPEPEQAPTSKEGTASPGRPSRRTVNSMERVTVRMTAAEVEVLRALAELRGHKTNSEAIRSALLEQARQSLGVSGDDALAQALTRVETELRGEGKG